MRADVSWSGKLLSRPLALLAMAALCVAGSCAVLYDGNIDVLPPLHLTIVVHNEEDTGASGGAKLLIPDYNGDQSLLRHFTEAMRAFAGMAASHGARINFGSDWTFSEGVARFDPSFYTDLEAMGHEVDAHAHESHRLYEEVRGEIADAGGSPTSVASGLNEDEIQERLAYFDRLGGSFRILWGVALPGHGAGECTAAFVWRPARGDWTVHDPEGDYIYIGHGELVNGLGAIRRAVAARRGDRVNTCAVFVSVREFKAAEGAPGINDARWTAPTDSAFYWENRVAWWDHFLGEIDEMVAAGDVVYASLTEVAAAFEAREDELVFGASAVPRSDAPLRTRNLRAGYPLE